MLATVMKKKKKKTCTALVDCLSLGLWCVSVCLQVPAYICAQVLGAIASAFTLRLILNPAANEGATLPVGSDAQSLLLEIITTFILMFVVAAVATDNRAVSKPSPHGAFCTRLIDL
jgi:glycerol uptake facilitator-like aquaporin